MRRRTYLAAASAAFATAGCLADRDDGASGDGTDANGYHGTDHDAPGAVYVPEHATAMTMEGMNGDEGFQFSVMASSPEPFYVVDGSDVYVQSAEEDHDLHVMVAIWDPETGIALPETGLSVEILDSEGQTVAQEVIYAMVSQRMGFHYGGNFSLDGFGEYTARVSVGAVSVERTRGFAGSFDAPATVEIPISFAEGKTEKFTDADPGGALEPGALSPMSMGMMPTGTLPAPESMPGRTVGTGTVDDTVLHGGVVTGTELGGADPYFYVSPRTPYNRFPLPSMRVAAVFDTGSGTERVDLTRTLDPELNYHYGAPLSEFDADLDGVDAVEAVVDIPPQVTRHAGYETAMLETGSTTLR